MEFLLSIRSTPDRTPGNAAPLRHDNQPKDVKQGSLTPMLRLRADPNAAVSKVLMPVPSPGDAEGEVQEGGRFHEMLEAQSYWSGWLPAGSGVSTSLSKKSHGHSTHKRWASCASLHKV